MDVFYKIRSLKDAGISVILHIFEYNRPKSVELLDLCKEVYYYPRETGWISQFSLLPYIVRSRKSKELLNNLAKDAYPVLFEGLHTCFYLDHPFLKQKQKIVRMHNIEHEYYAKLSKVTTNIKSKLFFRIESLKLKRFEKILKFANYILAISHSDSNYFMDKYGKTVLIGAFHSNQEISSIKGKGEFILMHGNLSVEENESAIIHCVRNIFNQVDFPVVVAGKGPSNLLKREISRQKSIVLVENPSEQEMERLQHEAHIHLCYTFQSSGVKLKLLNSLFKGRFVVSNPMMTEGSGLDNITMNGQHDTDIIDIIKKTIPSSFTSSEIEERKKTLDIYSNKKNAEKIIELLN
jgi:hypothetical protein